MNTVITCTTCGSIIHKHYRYCPFCGNRKSNSLIMADMVNISFAKLERVRTKNYLSRLDTLNIKLAKLEKELDTFVCERSRVHQ